MTGLITILADKRDEDGFPIFKEYPFEEIKFDHIKGTVTVFLENRLSFYTLMTNVNRIWVEE